MSGGGGRGGRRASRGRSRAPVPAPVEVRTERAVAHVIAEPGRPTGRLLWLDDHEAGAVDLADPRRLAFGYMRRIADAIDGFRPPGAAIDAVHLGGGAFALPRYVAATRPRSVQEVHELDPGVVAVARAHLRLRTSPRLVVRVGDAARLVAARGDASADVVVGDAFAGPEVPPQLSSPAFAAEVRRILRPAGLYALNVIALPPGEAPRRHAAVLAGAFAHLAVIAPPRVLRARAPGNAILLASRAPLPLAHLRRALGGSPEREALLDGAEALRFAGERGTPGA